jgi:uncharacterized protein involved in exopolysaccharide biosynthesis
MNVQSKFERQDQVHLYVERSDLRAHYEDVVTKTLRATARYVVLIITLTVLGGLSAAVVLPLLPRKYSAEALVRPHLFSREEGTKVEPLVSIDAAALVASEARLIRSDPIVRAVAQRLGLDRVSSNPAPPMGSLHAERPGLLSVCLDRLRAVLHWARVTIVPPTHAYSAMDRAIVRLRADLAINNDTRTYLISIGATAPSPEEAAAIANAFAVEYLRTKMLQRRADALMAAIRDVAQRSAVFGDKHPSMVRAREELEAARARMAAATNSTDLADQDLVAADGVVLAQANPMSASPRAVVVLGLAILIALLCGVVLAVWLDRRRARSRQQAAVQLEQSPS